MTPSTIVIWTHLSDRQVVGRNMMWNGRPTTVFAALHARQAARVAELPHTTYTGVISVSPYM